MFLLKKLLSSWLLPPLGLLLVAIVASIFGWRRRGGRTVVTGSITLALAMSLPLVANQLAKSLEGNPVSMAALGKAQAIVILGGGVRYGAAEYGGDTVSETELERLRYGAKLARETQLPILVSGGSVYGGRAEAMLMKQILETEFSVPVRWVEGQSRDTAQNAAFSASLLKASGIQRIALVTHAWHMSRAVADFKHRGLEVVPAPMGFAPQGTSIFENLLPSMDALERSANVIHEWVGRLLLS